MIKVLYQDQDVVVAVKPENVPSQKDFSRDPDLLTLLAKQLGSELYLIHRLDRHVAGPVVLAKNKKAAAQLSKQLESQMFSKKYYAVVVLSVEDKDRTGIGQRVLLKHYITKVKNLAVIKSRIDTEISRPIEGYKEARMSYRVVTETEVEQTPVAFLDIDLETGRYHQIRAQLSYERMPILGDPKYGITSLGGQSFKQIGLIAYELRFMHPITRKEMCFQEVDLHSPFTLFSDLIEGEQSKF